MARLPDPSRWFGDAVITFYLVARREFSTRVRTRFFLIGTVLLMALLGGYIVLQARVFGAPTTVTIGFAGDAQALARPLEGAATAAGLKVEVRLVSDVQTGEDEVRAGTLDALVSGDAAAPTVAVKYDLDPTLSATLSRLVQQVALTRALTSSGVDAAAIEAGVASARIHLVFLDPNASVRSQRLVVGVFVAALLYVALLLYGQFVAAGVVEEKANRIVEVLLPTVRPRQLLFGKVVGIGLVGFVQLLLLGLVALVAVARTQVIKAPDASAAAVTGGLLWFVLGFILFALMFAAAGSLVSRQEDLGAVTTPITMLAVGSYLAFFWVVSNPGNPIGVVLSMIPPFAPILMPARIATGDAQVWQVAVAVALTLVAIVALTVLAARIYSNSVLRVGSRVKLFDALKGST